MKCGAIQLFESFWYCDSGNIGTENYLANIAVSLMIANDKYSYVFIS